MTRLVPGFLALLIAVVSTAAPPSPTAGRGTRTPLALQAVLAASPSQFLVVPGRSIGAIAIGMRLAAVEQILGRPSKIDPTGQTQWYEWKSPENRLRSIAVETAQNTVVLISLAHDPRYRTSEGLGDGTTLVEVQRVLGRPSSVMQLGGFSIVQYRRIGIGFVTDGTGRVTGIIIAPRV